MGIPAPEGDSVENGSAARGGVGDRDARNRDRRGGRLDDRSPAPVLVRLHAAARGGTSLAVVFLNALSGSIAYMIQGRVLYRMGVAFAVATVPGALLGATLVQYLDSRRFTLLFALFLLALAGLLLRGRTIGGSAHRHPTPEELNSLRSRSCG